MFLVFRLIIVHNKPINSITQKGNLMSSSKNTFIAFLLNLSFSIIEFIFGWLFGSSAILADAVHDLGDALAIGSSAIMQTYANKPADRVYPFGYKRWNILAALLTSSILIIGSSRSLWKTSPISSIPSLSIKMGCWYLE